jgi:hypothetical protein
MPITEEKIITQLEKFRNWTDKNQNKVQRYTSIVAIIVGLFTMSFTYHMGNAYFYLLLDGVKTEGKIVEYKEHGFLDDSGFYSTSFMPVIEFQTEHKVVRFKDWLGHQSNGMTGEVVAVIFNSANPAVAMVDRRIANWIPFSIFMAGLLLVVASIKNWFKFS